MVPTSVYGFWIGYSLSKSNDFYFIDRMYFPEKKVFGYLIENPNISFIAFHFIHSVLRVRKTSVHTY